MNTLPIKKKRCPIRQKCASWPCVMAETIRERTVVGPVCEDTLLPPPLPEASHPQRTNNKEAKKQEWGINRVCVCVRMCMGGVCVCVGGGG